MKHFLHRIILFLIPLLVFAYPIDLLVSTFLKHSTDFSGELEVWKDIYDPKKNYDLAVYGSSRAWVQIDPEILSDSLKMSAYNYGINGHNFRLQYLRHIELLKNNKKPNTIILSVDMFTLQRRSDLFQSEQFLPYMLWNDNIRIYTKIYNGFRAFDYYLPLVRYFGRERALGAAVKGIFNVNNSSQHRKLGYFGHDREWNSDLDDAKTLLSDYKVIIDEETVQLFEKFIEDCRDSNIQVILIYTPEHIDGQNFVSNRTEVMQIFRRFADAHNMHFLDYSDLEICRDKTYFYNANHLNLKGSRLFTRKLSFDIKTLSLLNPKLY